MLLSERSQSKKAAYCTIPMVEQSEKDKLDAVKKELGGERGEQAVHRGLGQ
jgi:hypothetical protein